MAEKSIRLATLADVPQMADCFATGFINDDVFGRFMHPKRHEYPEDWRRYWTSSMRDHVVEASTLAYARIDASGTVRGCCLMKRLGPGGTKRDTAEPFTRKAERLLVSAQRMAEQTTWLDRSADKEAMATFDRNWDENRHHFTGSREECWMIELLCVRRDFQKKGYGTELVMNAIEHAISDNVPLAVIASDVADSFYENIGFREVGNANQGEMKGCLGGSIKFYEMHLQK